MKCSAMSSLRLQSTELSVTDETSYHEVHVMIQFNSVLGAKLFYSTLLS